MTAEAALAQRVAEPALSAHGLGVTLGGRPVLHGVSAAWRPGWTAVVGPNGAGKSTLLRALAGLLSPDHGEVRLHGRPLAAWSPRARGRELAWLAQAGPVSGELTARETVQLGRLAHLGLFDQASPADEVAVDAAMQATGCTAWASRRLQALSGGERQRVLLARALATGAPVLLLDEPTAHLDPPHQVALVRLLRTLAATRTVVSVLHELTLALRADRVLVLHEGRLLADGAPRDPALQAALQTCFEHAIHIDNRGVHPVALPALD